MDVERSSSPLIRRFGSSKELHIFEDTRFDKFAEQCSTAVVRVTPTLTVEPRTWAPLSDGHSARRDRGASGFEGGKPWRSSHSSTSTALRFIINGTAPTRLRRGEICSFCLLLVGTKFLGLGLKVLCHLSASSRRRGSRGWLASDWYRRRRRCGTV